MTFSKENLNRLFMLINTIIIGAMIIGVIVYCAQVNYTSSIHNIDNITLANNATVGRIEHRILPYIYTIYVPLGFVFYAVVCIVFNALRVNNSLDINIITFVIYTVLYLQCAAYPMVGTGFALYHYINDKSWFFTDDTFYNSGWSYHSQNQFIPILACDSDAVKVDFNGNYTTKDCWSFGAFDGSVYTQCCARLVVDATPVYDLDKLVNEYVNNTTVITFMIVLAEIIDLVTCSITGGLWNRCCNSHVKIDKLNYLIYK